MSVSQGRTVVALKAQHLITEQYLIEKKQQQPKISAEIVLCSASQCKAPLIQGDLFIQSSFWAQKKNHLHLICSPSLFSEGAQPYYCGYQTPPDLVAVAESLFL